MNRGPASPEAQQAWLAAQASQIGRYQWPELFYSQDTALTTPATINIPRSLNINRPIESMQIVLRGRVTVTAANFGSVAPEAPATLLQRVILNGTHTSYGNLTPLNMSGATLFAWPQLFQPFSGNDCIINATKAGQLGRPLTSPFLGTTAGSPYDFTLVYNVPFAPLLGIGQSTKRELANYLLQPADWGDTLQLQLQLGDATALGVLGGATAAFTAFGSATGSPTLGIYFNYGILGQFANRIKTGVVVRNETTTTAFQTAALQQRIIQLQKQITSNIVVKSGTTQASTTNGVNAFGTLVDTQLDRTQVIVDNKPVRNNASNLGYKSYAQRMFNTTVPAGYLPISFVESQGALLSYRGDGLAGGSQFELWSDILTGAATNQLNIVQEMIYGGPFSQLRPGA